MWVNALLAPSRLLALDDVTHVGGWLSLSGSNGHAPLKRADRIDENDPEAT